VSALPAQLQPLSAAPHPAAVQTAALGKSIDERPILQDINLQIQPGRYVALLGANGAGKSTLLKILATLTPASEGQLLLFGQEVNHDAAELRSRIGLIGHQSMLYRDLTARENLEFFGQLYGIPDPPHRAESLLEAVGLLDRADDPIKAFSRGMTQRVAIARALIHSPELLLADEPFEGLDAPSARSLEELLTQLHQSGKTVILVNHDIHQSLRLVERVVVLRCGRVVIDDAAANLNGEAVLHEMERA
jgi:ABC-type multidrug transport system ATPase subunit